MRTANVGWNRRKHPPDLQLIHNQLNQRRHKVQTLKRKSKSIRFASHIKIRENKERKRHFRSYTKKKRKKKLKS